MSTVKISELPNLPSISANTSNTLFLGVDLPTSVTGKFTATTLAQQLYANNALTVGNNISLFSNTIGQFSNDDPGFLQVNLQNLNSNGSGDYVITADTGTNANSYVDLGINNSAFDGGVQYSSMKPYDGYLYVHGQSDSSVSGNLVLGTASAGANVYVVVSNTQTGNIVGTFYKTGFNVTGNFAVSGLVGLSSSGLKFSDSSTQTTAAATLAYSEASFLKANTPSHVANSAAVYANGAFVQANAAFDKANSALANTSGTFGGNLTVSGNVTVLGTTSSTGPITTGNLIVNGTSSFTGNVTMNATTYLTGAVTVNSTMLLANSNFSATEAALTISASPTVATPSNDGYMIHISGKNGVPSRIVADSYGANSYIVFAGRAARGNVSYPTALQANDVISRFSGNGYGATGYSPLGTGRIDFVASENYTDTAKGSRIEFWNVPIGSNTLNKIASFNGDSVDFTGAIKPEKGLVYSPNVQSTLTTFAIDFNRDSLIKFNVTADASITLSNYVYGKVVEVWITNSAAQNKTITHGCLANNSTSKLTTFTISASSCAYLRYFSIDGDQANTFVSITA